MASCGARVGKLGVGLLMDEFVGGGRGRGGPNEVGGFGEGSGRDGPNGMEEFGGRGG